jgi:hypothetical protein
VNFLVDQLQTETAAIGDFKYHQSGDDNDYGESVGDTYIFGEPTDRVVGSQTEEAANIYKSVGVMTYSASYNLGEHGLFNASAGGVLMDRSVWYAPFNVSNGDSIEFDYRLTINSGG